MKPKNPLYLKLKEAVQIRTRAMNDYNTLASKRERLALQIDTLDMQIHDVRVVGTAANSRIKQIEAEMGFKDES